jgi:hypothetical protein
MVPRRPNAYLVNPCRTYLSGWFNKCLTCRKPAGENLLPSPNPLPYLLSRLKLVAQGQIGISLKEVALLCEVFLALVNTVVQEDVELVEQLRHNGGIILAIDGIQPEKGNEALYLLRDLISGRVLVARNLAASATAEIEKLIGEVLALGVPILGVISDKQESICLAIERQLPGVPHQLCHYHYLKDLAQPVCEADRNFNKQLKQQIRQLRSVEQ